MGRRPALDGLRGLAVLMVVFAHLELPSRYGAGGMVGVDVFFVLSGFLITTLLMEEHQGSGQVNFAGFYRRRAARLLPALGAFLTVAVITAAATGVDNSGTLRTAPLVIAYAGNWWIVTGHAAGVLGHTWSLAVEEQFYLLWPLVLLVALRGGRRLVASLAVLGILVAALQRTIACDSGSCVVRVYHSTDTRMDQLFVGVLLAVAFNAGLLTRVRRSHALLGWPALVVLVVMAVSRTAWDADWYDIWGMTATAVLAATVIAATLAEPAGRLARCLAWRPLAVVGMVSYGVYLWNALFLVLVRDGTTLPVSARSVIIVAGTAAATALSWRFVELPVLRRARAARGLRAAARSADAEREVRTPALV